MLAAVGLHRVLPQEIPAHCEGVEKLVVQVVAVGDDHQRRVGHLRRPYERAGQHQHRQALPRALRVPDDAALAVGSARGRLLHCNCLCLPVLFIASITLARALRTARNW